MVKRYLHQEIRREILTRIKRGTYPAGERIPGSRELTGEFARSTVIVDRTLTRLVERGYINRTARRASFVSNPIDRMDSVGNAKRNLVSLFVHGSPPGACFRNNPIQKIHDDLSPRGYQLLVNETSGGPAATGEYLGVEVLDRSGFADSRDRVVLLDPDHLHAPPNATQGSHE